MTMVPGLVKSAYGPGADKFDLEKSLDDDTGLGKDGVALGAIRNVDAGAMIFLNSGLRTSDVCGIGATKSILCTLDYVINLRKADVLMSGRKPAPGTPNFRSASAIC